LGIFAASELEYLSEALEKFFEVDGIVFGADVDRAVIEFFSCKKNLGIVSPKLRGDFYIGIGIVGLEEIIEFRFIFFDEIVFEIECFAFVFDDKEIKIIGLGKHVLLPYGIGRKILGYPLVEIFRFADIENASLFIFEKVDSWIRRNMRDSVEMHGMD